MIRLLLRTIPLSIAIVILTGCQTPQAKEASYLAKGKKEVQNKKYEIAIIYFKNAMAAQPKDPEPYYQLGLAYLASNDINVAGSYFKKTTELNPNHTGAQLKLAELMASSRSEAMVLEAQRRTQGVLALLPDDAEALNLLAITELRLGKPESAEVHLEMALRKAPGQLKSSIALAQSRLARGDAPGAEEALKQAVAQSPKPAEAVTYLGGFYRALGRTAEAEQQFRRALEMDPKHGPALLALGALQVRAGQVEAAEQTYRRASLLDNKAYKPLHALFLFYSGKRDQAVMELEALARQDPGDRDARTRVVTAYLSVNRVGDAEKVLTAVLKKNPRDTDALLQRSRIYLGSAKYLEAEADLNQVLRFRQDSQAYYLLSKVHQARGQSALRPQDLSQALRVDPRYQAARIEFAQILLASGSAESALQLLDEAPEDQRGAPEMLVQRSWVLLALARKDEARKGIDRVLAMARNPEALLQDALLKLDQRDYSGSRISAEESLKANPADTRALTVLLKAYAAQKQKPAGVQKAREHAAQHPNSAVVQQFLGELLLENGDRPGARKAFEAAKKADPALPAPEIRLAQLDAADGNRVEARKKFSALVSTHPENLVARLGLADLDVADRNFADAMEHYRKALALDGKNALALNGLAYLLAENNRADEALKYAQEAKQLAPENAAVDDTLGWTYFRKGMYSAAVPHLESATTKDGTALRKYHLAMAYLQAGDPKRGRQVLDAALKIDPKLPEAEEARQMFGTRK